MSYDNIIKLTDEQADRLHTLYQKEWWTAGRTRDDVRRMLRNAGHVYGVIETRSDALVAFARVLSDGVFKALVLDVIVDEDHRGDGLGERLMESILHDPRLARVRHFELYCLPEMTAYYERFGFTTDVGGVALMRSVRR